MPTHTTADLIVVLPGIMGSVLARDGHELWNHTLAVAGRHARSGPGGLDRLVLPPGTGDEDPGDGVEAVGLLKGLHVFPGVSAIDGYGVLLRFLERRLGLSAEAGNLLPFPYDWRLSVRLNARRLAARVEPALADWRLRSANPGAKAVFVAHSMGGLIARYYLDVLGGHAHTRSLLTIGTPYRGSLNALDSLHRGVAPRLGRLTAPFTRLARSLPSLHQLLPTWPCLVGEQGGRSSLAGRAVPGLDSVATEDALLLHRELDAAPGGRYALHVFGGYRQPTHQSARVTAAGLELRQDVDGTDHTGDGTVPRFSCFPAQLTDDSTVRHFAQKHGALQNEKALLNQVEAVLTSRDPRQFLDGRQELSVRIPDIADIGACPVAVIADDDRLTLAATATDEETGAVAVRTHLRNRGDGRYGTELDLPGPGTWRVAVGDPVNPGRVHEVTSIVLTG
ncbi:lipase/acyltransferase domain-containing protein [Streptomyces sp. NBC_01766]|uniref:lipase/acyltransferase domain-containing protein n=1 Tax=Streptomyces sp. NBC_01766 TaxID=2975936 RepID=UPI002DDC7B9E|nr:hypothetical protein [Streptomyces sp. NBC_01766]WSC23878.1 hypothetical protein OIE60_31735 [Streptomyces sp. NBC_01766]